MAIILSLRGIGEKLFHCLNGLISSWSSLGSMALVLLACMTYVMYVNADHSRHITQIVDLCSSHP